MAWNVCLVIFGLITVTVAYEVGFTYKYNYETKVSVDEEFRQSDDLLVGHGLKAKVHLTAIWQHPQNEQNIFKIQIVDAKSLVIKQSAFQLHDSNVDKIQESASYFLLENGDVKRLWDSSSSDHETRNRKRSIITLFQSKDKDQELKEFGVSGLCDVTYQVKENTIVKSKRNCVSPVVDHALSQAYGVRSSTAQQASTIDCSYMQSQSNILEKCTTTDLVKVFSNIWKKPSLCITAKSVFLFEESTKSENLYSGHSLEEVITKITKLSEKIEEIGIEATSFVKRETPLINLIDSVKKYQDSLRTTNLAKLKSASAFYKLLPLFQSATKENMLDLLTHKKFRSILPQILDLIAATTTENSVEAAMEFFSKSKGYDEMLERYLISLSVTPRPDSHVLKALMSLLGKGGHHEKITSTLVSTLGAVLRSYAGRKNSDEQVIENARIFLEKRLKKCDTESCSIVYLHGLRNAALHKSFPILLEYITKGGRQALEAALAMKNIPTFLPSEIQKSLLKVFHQVGQKQDRSTRSIIAEILLKREPEEHAIKSILAALSDQSDSEFTTFVASKVLDLMSSDKTLRTKVQKLLPEKDVSYYYALAQKGSSSIFARQLMTSAGTNVTYGIEMEMLEGGLLKRSTFDVEFQTNEGSSNLLSVGMFAEGLASFAGGSSEEGDVQSPTAGMELTLLGSSLRPYVFFSSTSELMSHAWSGTASEPTPALQGIFSLTDDENAVVLSNGMIVRLQTRGALSTDLSASIQISLWNRNSQSQVKNAGALFVKTVASVESDFVSTKGILSFAGESAIDFNTDLEFGDSPFRMCLKMDHPDIVIRHDVQRISQVTGSKYLLRRNKKRKRFIPRKSFALYRRNNEQCKLMDY